VPADPPVFKTEDRCPPPPPPPPKLEEPPPPAKTKKSKERVIGVLMFLYFSKLFIPDVDSLVTAITILYRSIKEPKAEKVRFSDDE
jgi:hypothetical protein